MDVLDRYLQSERVKKMKVDFANRVLTTTFFGESIDFAILDPIDVGDGAKVKHFHRNVTSSTSFFPGVETRV